MDGQKHRHDRKYTEWNIPALNIIEYISPRDDVRWDGRFTIERALPENAREEWNEKFFPVRSSSCYWIVVWASDAGYAATQ